jgi:hypothetical protein
MLGHRDAECHRTWATSFRLEPTLHHRLQAAATERGVTLTWLVNKLLGESLERLIPVDQLWLTQKSKDPAAAGSATPTDYDDSGWETLRHDIGDDDGR